MSEGARRRLHAVESPADDVEPRSSVRPRTAQAGSPSEAAFLREAGAVERAVRRALGLLPLQDAS